MKILVNLLSKEKFQNLIPAVQLKFDLVYRLDSGIFSDDYNMFGIITAIKHETVKYKDYDLIQNFNEISNIIKKHPNDEIIFNITGGTKFMNIAPILSCESHKNISCIYVNTQDKKIIQWKIENNKPNNYEEIPFDLKKAKLLLTIENYFAITDASIKSSDSILSIDEQNRLHVTREIFKNRDLCDDLKRFLGRDENKRNPNYTADNKKFGWDKENAYIKIDAKKIDFKTSFKNNSGQKEECYLSGSWFEEYVFNSIKNSFTDADVYKNVIVKNEINNNDQHEIDCLLIQDFNSIIIECKTGDVTQDNIFKLKGLKDRFGGIFAKAILVSYNEVKKTVLQIASELNIEIISGDNVSQMTSNIKKFLK